MAYRSLLKERRRALHAAICNVLAELPRSEKVAELLADHAELGEIWEKAVAYLRQAAANAIERSAYKEAISFLERALNALGRLPPTKSRAETAIELRLRLRVGLGGCQRLRRRLSRLRAGELNGRRRLRRRLSRLRAGGLGGWRSRNRRGSRPMMGGGRR